jgi:Ca2+-binding RTX toxin-like protein
MTRFLLLLMLALSLCFAGTALATEDDDFFDDGADVCAIDDGSDDEDLVGEDEDFFEDEGELFEGEDESFDDEEYLDEEDDYAGDEDDLEADEELFRASTATADDDCEADTGSDPAPETTSGPTGKPRKPRGTKGDDRLVGGDGRDRLVGRRGNDFLDGRGAADFLNGGKGDDEIVTGAAPKKGDRVLGGAGADVVRARNGARDRIDCGRGQDTVYAETGDRVRKSCETVKYR